MKQKGRRRGHLCRLDCIARIPEKFRFFHVILIFQKFDLVAVSPVKHIFIFESNFEKMGRLQGIPSNRKLFLGSFLLDGIRKFGSFLLDGIPCRIFGKMGRYRKI